MVSRFFAAAVAVVAPPAAQIAELAIFAYEQICQRLKSMASKQNRELCELLAGFLFRVKSESSDGGAPTKEWAVRLDALFDDVSAYVDACEGQSDMRILFSTIDRHKQVKRLREEIKALESTMEFHRS